MKIIFFGEDAFSLIALTSLVEANHVILGVFCPMYNNLIHTRLEKYCLNHSINFERISNFKLPVFVDFIRSLQPELLVICHFQKIIHKDLIEIAIFGSINLHPSLLPDYRGMAPQHWPLINGDKESGVTVHFIDEGVDTGDIIIQKKVKIEDDWYVFDLQNHMKPIYSTILKDAVKIISSGSNKYFIQKNLTGSYYGKLKIEDCQINLNNSCKDAFNLIRAVSYPYFGARFGDLIIWRAELIEGTNTEFDSINYAQLGYIKIENGQEFIKFKDGILKIIKSNKYEK